MLKRYRKMEIIILKFNQNVKHTFTNKETQYLNYKISFKKKS